MLKTIQIIIRGHVQGVGLRYKTQLKAESLNLKGRVENLQDGNVLCMIQGQDSYINSFLSWLKSEEMRIYVNEITIDSLNTEYIYNKFEIKR